MKKLLVTLFAFTAFVAACKAAPDPIMSAPSQVASSSTPIALPAEPTATRTPRPTSTPQPTPLPLLEMQLHQIALDIESRSASISPSFVVDVMYVEGGRSDIQVIVILDGPPPADTRAASIVLFTNVVEEVHKAAPDRGIQLWIGSATPTFTYPDGRPVVVPVVRYFMNIPLSTINKVFESPTDSYSPAWLFSMVTIQDTTQIIWNVAVVKYLGVGK